MIGTSEKQSAERPHSTDETGKSFGDGKPREDRAGPSATAIKKNILGRVDARREIRRPPLVGMQFLHQGPMGASDLLRGRAGLNAKDLISLLFRHFASSRRTPTGPRCRISLRVFTPAGLPAVKIRCK